MIDKLTNLTLIDVSHVACYEIREFKSSLNLLIFNSCRIFIKKVMRFFLKTGK